ncbi:type I restriction enzyme M protein [Natronocella acetinitrilica]|uniref:site-specific DNA-methyltransferase (adenine-specific) n=1 Tax=Natronocella acetinitrilica TaxID=414046 RepID=A0AAE3G461_9GAMM|nr:type I restriction-modification system subunit M [Natronocella acetinitrilica]MCP1674426.1 type I restriction enzyme M protein [Natronocella acetinitrilica]
MSEEQKNRLQAQLWAICNYLRGKMSGDEFRDYILGFIFYKFLSEQLYLIAEKTLEADGIDYAKIDDSDPDMAALIEAVREEAVDALGYHLAPGQLFRNVVARIEADADAFVLGDVQAVLNDIEKSSRGEESEDDFVHLFEDMDLSSSKLGKTPDVRNTVVKEILRQLSKIDFRMDEVEADVLGDSYEYLISNFASSGGKKAGEFYTPQRVSEILSRIVSLGKTELKSVYDPTCGSGSLLLRVSRHVQKVGRYYGQEFNRTTFNLARMNMILHKVHYKDFDIKQDDTLENPQHREQRFEAIVANPPFSLDWSANPLHLNDDRFSSFGRLAPKTKADMAFIQHMLFQLADNGTAAVVVPHGVLFRGAAEGHIRQHIIREMNALDAVIGLPQNLFFGTGIPTAILVFKKCRKDSEHVLFIDASRDFAKGKNQNTLRSADVRKIIDTLDTRSSIDKYSHLASLDEIRENDYNLNIPRYVDTFEEEDAIDLMAVQAERAEIEQTIAGLNEQMAGYLREIGYVS